MPTWAEQQGPDRAFRPTLVSPAYPEEKGPVVCVDEAHAFHTLDERFWAFGELLRRDGYVVRPSRVKFDRTASESERDAAFAKPTIFRTTDGTLRSDAIVRGRHAGEAVTAIRTFTGQAFRAPPEAEPVLILPGTFISLLPEKAWQFSADTRRQSAAGWLQGAVTRVESGRAAFFGEAAMFSAQVAGPERRPMGMNAPGAEQNFQFVLNVLHWLSGLL